MVNTDQNFNKKLYHSQMAYETNIFFGTLAKLYFSASEINTSELETINSLLESAKGHFIENSHVRSVAKAMKYCYVKELEFNYENLSRVKEFKETYKDKESFISVLSLQLIPTELDIKLYVETISSQDESNTFPILSLVLDNDKFKEDYPEFLELVESIKKKVEDNSEYKFKSTVEVLKSYEEVERQRETGEGFFTSGFSSLDRYLTEGFAPGKITICAGRPGMGKSNWVVNIMKNLASQGIHTAQFVLEMDNISFMDRLISSMAMIELDKLIKDRDVLTPSELASINLAKQTLINNQYLHLNDTPSPSLETIKKGIMDLQKKIGQKYAVVVIDLFDKISDLLSNYSNMSASFHLVLNSIQRLAKELQVHFILVAQINRASEQKTDKRPTLVNLKHSGAYEEIADLIMFIDRPSYRMIDNDTSDLDTDYENINLTSSLDYDTIDKYAKKFDNDTAFANLEEEDESIASESIKDNSKELSKKLAEQKMIQVGQIVIPVDQFCEIIIAKQRQGISNKVIPFIFKAPYCSFTSINLVTPFTA